MGQLLVHLLHPLNVVLALLDVVHHGHWVVTPNHTLACTLHWLGCCPRLMDVFGWEVFEYREVCSVWEENKIRWSLLCCFYCHLLCVFVTIFQSWALPYLCPHLHSFAPVDHQTRYGCPKCRKFYKSAEVTGKERRDFKSVPPHLRFSKTKNLNLEEY